MGRHPARHRERTTRALLVAIVVVVAAALLPTAPAGAAARPTGHVERVTQNAHGTITVSGWAFDRGRRFQPISVDIAIDGRFVARVATTSTRADVNRIHRITGRHGFAWSAHRAPARVVTVVARPLVRGEPKVLITTAYLHGYRPAPPAGTRIISEAKKYVGRAPYVSGGASPRGFDCSGYTQYVYRAARVANLPRTAEQQRRATRHILASQARPGDLIFYIGARGAYHIAIYAGHGMQYAAATPRDGVRYQRIWSRATQFGTDWH